MAKLGKEQIMVAADMVQKGTSVRQVARQMGVSEGALRYRLKKRAEAPKPDGRALQPTATLLPEEVALKTANAYQMKLAFQEFWSGSAGAAGLYLERWLKTAEESGLEPMVRVAKTLRAHRDGRLNYFWSRITNGLLEGINRLVQAVKAKARGYRSTRNPKTIVYLLAGKLPLKPLPIRGSEEPQRSPWNGFGGGAEQAI